MWIFRIQLKIPILLSFCTTENIFGVRLWFFFKLPPPPALKPELARLETECLVLACRREAGSVLKTIWYPWKNSLVRSIFDNRFPNDMWSCFEASWARAWGCSEKNVLNFWTSAWGVVAQTGAAFLVPYGFWWPFCCYHLWWVHPYIGLLKQNMCLRMTSTWWSSVVHRTFPLPKLVNPYHTLTETWIYLKIPNGLMGLGALYRKHTYGGPNLINIKMTDI